MGILLYIMRQITHYICGWVCPHKIFVILLRESGLIFFQVHGLCSVGIKRGLAGPRPIFIYYLFIKLLQENG